MSAKHTTNESIERDRRELAQWHKAANSGSFDDLISQRDELLAALRGALASLEKLPCICDYHWDKRTHNGVPLHESHCPQFAEHAARAAIAKAEGI